MGRSVSGQMPKRIAAEIPGDTDKRVAAQPTCNSPQQVIRRDEQRQKQEGTDEIPSAWAFGESVDESLDAVLGSHRAEHGADDRDHNGEMRRWASPEIAADKGNGSLCVLAKVIHRIALSVGLGAWPKTQIFGRNVSLTDRFRASRSVRSRTPRIKKFGSFSRANALTD